MEKHITAPITKETAEISSRWRLCICHRNMYTARDAAHKRMDEASGQRRRTTN